MRSGGGGGSDGLKLSASACQGWGKGGAYLLSTTMASLATHLKLVVAADAQSANLARHLHRGAAVWPFGHQIAQKDNRVTRLIVDRLGVRSRSMFEGFESDERK